jgi:hypothetical protein
VDSIRYFSRNFLRIALLESNKHVGGQLCLATNQVLVIGAVLMRIGLTLEEFVELERKPIARGEQLLTIEEAAEHIRQRGYCCRPQSLKLLMKGRPLEASNRICSRDLIESCCDYFETHEFFTPYVEMCRVLGCNYFAFLRALKDASERESEKYGTRVRMDDQLFVMHRSPAREEHAAVITFTLCEDIRDRLIRGEGV